MSMSDLGSLFVSGSVYKWADGTPLKLEVVEAGQLRLRSGRLVACDPGWPMQSVARDVRTVATIDPGSYPVALTVAWPQSGRSVAMVSAARVTVTPDEVVSWVPAREGDHDGDSPAALGFSVDSGLACFLDDEAVPLLARYADDDAFDELVERVLGPEAHTDVTDEETGLNIVVFCCGLGDGNYPVWLGLTSDGRVAQIVADLEVLSHCTGPVTTP